jgi:hypothetical protein
MGARYITMKERSSLLATIERLLVRHLVSHTCPLSTKDYFAIYYASLDQESKDLYDAARKQREEKDGHPVMTMSALGVKFHPVQSQVLGMYIPYDLFKDDSVPMFQPPEWVNQTPLALDQMGLSAEKQLALSTWAMACPSIYARCANTDRILTAVVSIMATPGQLHRCVPDLVKYLDADSIFRLEGMERRSPVPDKWMEFNRAALRDALDHLGLCYLLPETERGLPYELKSFVDHGPWAVCQSTLRYIDYSAREVLKSGTPLSSFDHLSNTWNGPKTEIDCPELD